ncbi:hypothetical protein LTR36_007005 [Oleoguttula mirabilis]|uniref:DUF7820 domain-containing protein n=1 Tax=Oleoguttula mirabilis TaxID=1507867 RepID=A0AAV9JCL4_9PEZI|nr:hypothetical protein LTR36_007005 [Oleoguttula mirabilis]
MERRSLLDGDMTPPHDSANVFDDTFEVEDFDFVADGFRPSEHDTEGENEQVEVAEQPVRTVSAHYADRPVSPTAPNVRPSRNSMRKSRGPDNPFASPEDAEERVASLSFEPDMAHHRSVSSASSHHFARTSSPRFGAGPSHPYGMYAQGTIPRSPSTATQSTIRPPPRPSSTSARAGPQHPYTLYPQGVSEDLDDEEEDTPQAPVPIGFPGLGQSYQRRMGPDGEEQDIIGEDGHTEQLPPYTRYPEDGPEKVPLLVPEAPTALHSRAPVAGTDPTMDLMHTTLLPQLAPQLRQSMTDQSLLHRRDTSMSNVELLNSTTSQSSLASNKSWSDKSWKEKRKTRFCGIPLWWYLLSIGVVAFIAIVLGAVIGRFISVHPRKQRVPVIQTTALYDASPIATPTSGSPATGTYALSYSTPQETQVACLTEQGQQVAWSCDIGGTPAAAISVGILPNGNESGAFIFYANDDNNTMYYGTQGSFMNTNWAPFMTVQDNDDKGSGPAFYFQQFYDKVVVLPETALSVPSSKKKRQNLQLNQGWLQQKQAAVPGEKPWFCVWNNTFVEGFIYVEETIAATYSLTSSSTQATSSANASQTFSSSSPPPAAPSTTTTSYSGGSPSDYMMSTTITMPSTTATYSGPVSAYTAWSSGLAQAEQGSNNANANNNNNNNGYNKRQFIDEDLYTTLQLYPYVVKIEERRLPNNAVQPYCRQYQILDDGGYSWLSQPDGSPIVVQLEEQDPSYAAYESAGVAGSKKLKEKRLVPGGCHCQWISGQSAD